MTHERRARARRAQSRGLGVYAVPQRGRAAATMPAQHVSIGDARRCRPTRGTYTRERVLPAKRVHAADVLRQARMGGSMRGRRQRARLRPAPPARLPARPPAAAPVGLHTRARVVSAALMRVSISRGARFWTSAISTARPSRTLPHSLPPPPPRPPPPQLIRSPNYDIIRLK